MPFPGLARGRGFIHSMTLIRVRLGTVREGEQVRQLQRGGVRRRRSRADTEDGQHSRERIKGMDPMNRDRSTPSTKKTKGQFMLCSLSVH